MWYLKNDCVIVLNHYIIPLLIVAPPNAASSSTKYLTLSALLVIFHVRIVLVQPIVNAQPAWLIVFLLMVAACVAPDTQVIPIPNSVNYVLTLYTDAKVVIRFQPTVIRVKAGAI